MELFHITPDYSMNRVVIADVPGIDVDSDVRGKTGGELMSAAYLTQLIRQQADALNLDAALNDHALRMGFVERLTSEDDQIYTAASQIARRLGRNLGYILLTLKRGDQINRSARPEWDESHWSRWASIRQVWLGGGLMNGILGQHIWENAQAVLQEAGVQDYALRVAQFPNDLPLIGAARYAPEGVNAALVCDFGQTLMKRALAYYDERGLLGLQKLPSIPTNWHTIVAAEQLPRRQAEAFLKQMVTVLVDALQVLPHDVQTLALSVAAYVRDGQPIQAQRGIYMQLREITDNLQQTLSRQISTALQCPISAILLHDGTAAASAYAGQDRAAVITLGTAMGIGFPPPSESFRPISDAFKLTD